MSSDELVPGDIVSIGKIYMSILLYFFSDTNCVKVWRTVFAYASAFAFY